MVKVHNPVSSAIFMVTAGAIYAVVNFVTAFVTGHPEWGCKTAQGTACLAYDSRSYTFFQYGIALLCTLPFLMGKGSLKALRTHSFPLHLLRVATAVIGVELWVAGFARGVPLWTMVALLMTSPLFVVAGSVVFLKEHVGLPRFAATLVGFAGALIILEPWQGFDTGRLFPLAASVAWALSSLCVRPLAQRDSAETITLWLLILFTPLAFVATYVYPDLSGQSGSFWGFGKGVLIPEETSIILLFMVAGFLSAMAQLCLALSYKMGDASYVQPFDHVKLIFNILISWWLFRDSPQGVLWIGILFILGSSVFIGYREMYRHRSSTVKLAAK